MTNGSDSVGIGQDAEGDNLGTSLGISRSFLSWIDEYLDGPNSES